MRFRWERCCTGGTNTDGAAGLGRGGTGTFSLGGTEEGLGIDGEPKGLRGGAGSGAFCGRGVPPKAGVDCVGAGCGCGVAYDDTAGVPGAAGGTVGAKGGAGGASGIGVGWVGGVTALGAAGVGTDADGAGAGAGVKDGGGVKGSAERPFGSGRGERARTVG